MGKKIQQVIIFVFEKMHIEMTEKTLCNIIQFLKFCIIGVSNTIISYLLNIMVLYMLQAYKLAWDYIAGNMVAFILSVLWSFYWNNCFVFVQENGKKRSILKTLLKTYMAYGFTGIILNNVLSCIWINLLYISKYLAPLINLVISVPLNFIINKLWAFKSEK